MTKLSHLMIRSARLGYGKKAVLDIPILEFEPGRIYCVFGRNGGGKTTLIKTLGGILSPLEGEVKLNGENLHVMSAHERARRMSVVLTKAPFNASMTVHDFVSFGRYPYTNWLGEMSGKDEQIITESLHDCGLSEMKGRLMAEISDGEMQKAQIARTLAQKTDVLLLDEPVAHLDLVNKAEIFRILRLWMKKENGTVIFSSHDVAFALQLADAFVVIDQGSTELLSVEKFRSERWYEKILASPYLNIEGRDGSVTFRNPD